MAQTLRKYFTWWLYLLYLGNGVATILAKTNTSSHILSEDVSESNNYSEFEEEEEDSGFLVQNFTSSRARNLRCVPMIKHFEVLLTESLKVGEGVGLTGDHKKLGEWQIDKSLEMKRRMYNPYKWHLKIPMCSALRVYYRFFVYHKDENGFKRIRYWEGQQHARVMEAYEMFRHKGSQKFGHAHALAVGGGVQQERGWLRKEKIIQLKFIWPQHIRFTEFTHFIRKPKYILNLKVFPEGRSLYSYQSLGQNDDIDVQVTRFANKESKLKKIKEQGEFYKPGDVLVFHITTVDSVEHLYVLGVYTLRQELLGEIVITSELIKQSEGILELPIFDTKEKNQVGWLTLPFLRISALPQALKLNMRASFHHYWPHNWPTLDIGHRGLGKSFYYHVSNATENTIESFLKAQQLNADMIKFDVQLTKDYVAVVWQDLGFLTVTSHNNKKKKDNHLSYVYIHDLTYQELLKKRVFLFIKGLMIEVTHLNTVFVPDKKRIFPRLAQVYQELSLTLGIVMNIKWPQLLGSGSLESLQSLDKNRYVDALLQTTMEFGCGRPLIMASFDADICTMLRFKQHMYPVVFLTLGQYSPWESYADLRTHSLTSALQFAQASDILGTAVYAKEIILTPTAGRHLDMAFELQQPVFVWGDLLNDSSLLDYLREQEVAGLIYDRIDLHLAQKTKMKRKRFGFFEAQELQRIFLRQCIAAGNMTIKEGLPDTHSPFWPRFRSLN